MALLRQCGNDSIIYYNIFVKELNVVYIIDIKLTCCAIVNKLTQNDRESHVRACEFYAFTSAHINVIVPLLLMDNFISYI